jgi:F-type H+-transporting ATPase subunit b
MSPWLANFLFEMVNFLLLAAALGWLLFKPVRQTLEAESKEHAQLEAEAQQRHAEADALLTQTQAAFRQARADIERQRSELLAAVHKEAEQIRENAERKVAAERKTNEQDLEAARHEEASRLTATVGSMAAEAVRRLLLSLDGPALDVALVRGACDQLRALPRKVRASAVVETARPLSPDGRRLLSETLGSDFEERTASELGAGIRVTTSLGQVDASAAALAREAARSVEANALPPSDVRHG